MSIVILGPDSAHYKGGIAQFTTRLGDELSKHTAVHHESWHRMYPPFLTKRDFRDTVSQKKTGHSKSQNKLDYLNPLSWFAFVRQVKRSAPEKLVVTWIHPVHSPVYFIILALIRLLTKTKVILLCHNVLPHESVPLQRPLTQLVFSLVDEAIVHGSTEKDLASNFIGADRITQLYHPLFDVLPESAQSTEQKTDSSALDMLVFGAIRPYKGTSILLDAMANLRSEGVNLRLTIAGEPFDDQHETILEKIAELHLEDLVQVRMEYIPNEDIEPLFKGCDVAMYPYLSATQSGSLAMAYACGAPVIATRVGGLTDVVADGVSGYLVEPTAEGVADGIRAFLAEPVSSESVLDFADRELSWERYAAELIKL